VSCRTLCAAAIVRGIHVRALFFKWYAINNAYCQDNADVTRAFMPKLSSSTILGHLTVLGITVADLAQCLTLEDEWSFIKKHHFNHIKVCHPDKGGDADTFRAVNDSFNVLRELVSKKQVKRFASESSRATAPVPASASASQGEYAPWEWYEEAGKVDFVPYIVSTKT